MFLARRLRHFQRLVTPLVRPFSQKGPEDKDYSKNETFGFTKVDSEQRQDLVNGVFSSVASSYDVMNDLMSMGIHRFWKTYFITEAGSLKPKRILENGRVTGNERISIIDVAGGTGDIAFRLLEKHRKSDPSLKDINIKVFDINPEMLKVGQQNATNRGLNLDNLE